MAHQNCDVFEPPQVHVEKMDTKARDTAVREAVALRRVQHPNVVRFREVFVRSGWLCLVMDFADGGDLCAAIKDWPVKKLGNCQYELCWQQF